MKKQFAFLLLAYCATLNVLSAQTEIDTAHRCLYNQLYFLEEPYIFARGDEAVDRMVADICLAAGVEQNFSVVSASIPGIAAITDDSGKYLLYSRRYVRRLQTSNPTLLYAILAHEIGHLVRGHQLDGSFRLREESAADEFMGRALFQLGQTGALREILDAIQYENFAYAPLLNFGMRNRMIAMGWNAADGVLRSNNNLGFLENEDNLENLPLPLFKLKGCPRSFDFPASDFSSCKLLRDVDRELSGTLKVLGYSQLSYYHVPNGFALLTPVEQIHKNGTALPDADRWKDYPAGGRFEGVLNYLSSLIVPRPGYFRLFIFLVSDQNVRNTGGTIQAEEARVWLQNGGFWLPEEIGSREFTSGHHITTLVFEFEAPESTKQLSELCVNQLLTPEEHLNKSGLMQVFRE